MATTRIPATSDRACSSSSALVVNRAEYKPSDIFFEWMEYLNVLPDLEEETVLAFWANEVNKAHNWYKSHRKRNTT